MTLRFTDLVVKVGFDPSHVRLLRHQTKAPNGRTPYVLWRDQRAAFEEYQSVQASGNRVKLAAPLWASFVAPPAGGTLFVGIYASERIGVIDAKWIDPLYGVPGTNLTKDGLDRYQSSRSSDLEPYIGRLWIDWGAGARTWIQRVDRQNKAIVELTRSFREDVFPGYTHFVTKVSEIQSLPATWVSVLRSARGIYLLTSAKTREQYVGSATGEGGFHARWVDYAADGHGGNIGLKSNEPSDYQVSILEVSGSAATNDEILAIEQLWKRKLQSREMGLNRNEPPAGHGVVGQFDRMTIDGGGGAPVSWRWARISEIPRRSFFAMVSAIRPISRGVSRPGTPSRNSARRIVSASQTSAEPIYRVSPRSPDTGSAAGTDASQIARTIARRSLST